MSFGTMKTRIANELNRGSLASEIENAILSALDFHKRKHFRFNQARTTTSLTAGIEFSGLPTDFIEADTMVLTEGSERDILTERSHYWIDENQQWTGYRSRPQVWSVQAGEIRLYPIPDKSTYSLTLTYVYELAKPSDDTDTSAWFTDGEELIRTHAKIDLLENVIRGPESFQEAQILRMREAEILTELKIEHKRAQSSGRLSPQ